MRESIIKSVCANRMDEYLRYITFVRESAYVGLSIVGRGLQINFMLHCFIEIVLVLFLVNNFLLLRTDIDHYFSRKKLSMAITI